MRNISLLPAELKSYKKSAGRISRIAVAVIILLLVFVLVYVSLSFAYLAPGRELAQVRSQRAETGQKIAELKHYRDIASETSVLEGKIKKAMGKNPGPDVLLPEIFGHFPVNTRLNELSIDYISDGNEIKMRGLADSHVYVADILESLKSLESLDGVECKSSVVSGADGASYVQFEISAGVAGAKGNETPAVGEGSETPAGGGGEQ